MNISETMWKSFLHSFFVGNVKNDFALLTQLLARAK